MRPHLLPSVTLLHMLECSNVLHISLLLSLYLSAPPHPGTIEEESPYQDSHQNSHIDFSGCI